MIGWIILGAIWLPSMVLGYGLAKGNRRSFCENALSEKYGLLDELILWFVLLVAAPLVLYLAWDKRASVKFIGTKAFCFRMPEHCKTRNEN